jgi:hypothetical protein
MSTLFCSLALVVVSEAYGAVNEEVISIDGAMVSGKSFLVIYNSVPVRYE